MIYSPKLIPKTTGQIVITLGFTIHLLGSVVHGVIFSTVDPFTIADGERIFEWSLRILRDLGLIIGFGGMVSFGMRTLRKEKILLKNFFVPSIGLISLICMSLIGFYASEMMNCTLDLFENPINHVEKFKDKSNDQNITMAQRSKFSEIYATLIYDEQGIIIEYLNPNGELELYQPSEAQIKTRKEMLQNKIAIKWVQSSLEKAGFFWAAIAIISLLLGFFPNRRMST